MHACQFIEEHSWAREGKCRWPGRGPTGVLVWRPWLVTNTWFALQFAGARSIAGEPLLHGDAVAVDLGSVSVRSSVPQLHCDICRAGEQTDERERWRTSPTVWQTKAAHTVAYFSPAFTNSFSEPPLFVKVAFPPRPTIKAARIALFPPESSHKKGGRRETKYSWQAYFSVQDRTGQESTGQDGTPNQIQLTSLFSSKWCFSFGWNSACF